LLFALILFSFSKAISQTSDKEKTRLSYRPIFHFASQKTEPMILTDWFITKAIIIYILSTMLSEINGAHELDTRNQQGFDEMEPLHNLKMQ